MMSTLQNGVDKDPVFTIDVRMQCPRCRGNIRELDCASCGLQMQVYDGIVDALPPERVAHYERFIRDYESIRAAEGRSPNNAEFYLNLPYKDVSSRNAYQWRIRASSYDYLMKRVVKPNFQNGGELILDLGAGNGWMSYRLMLRGHRPVAVDLAVAEMDGLAAGRHYQRKLPRMFWRFQAELDRLPFTDRQFDLAIFNASFHYSEDYAETLGEAIRCVRPGGSIIVADTAWYSREESGRQMLAERQQDFVQRYGFPSDGISSLEFLTDRRLDDLERNFGIRWQRYTPFYGFRWAMRPLEAKLKGKREPSRFRIYVAEVAR